MVCATWLSVDLSERSCVGEAALKLVTADRGHTARERDARHVCAAVPQVQRKVQILQKASWYYVYVQVLYAQRDEKGEHLVLA